MADGRSPTSITGAPADLKAALAKTVKSIASLTPGDQDARNAAFDALYRGVGKASSGKLALPTCILGDLEPKKATLQFLVEVHEHRKLLRKRVTVVLHLLLQVDSWLKVLTGDDSMRNALPEVLRAVLEECEAEAARTGVLHAADVVTKQEESAAGVSPSNLRVTPSDESAIIGSPIGRPSVRAEESLASRLQSAIDLVVKVTDSQDEDAHQSAFNGLHREVLHACTSLGAGQQCPRNDVLAPLASRFAAPVFLFLINLHKRRRILQRRILELVSLLLLVGPWLAALQGNAELCARLPADIRSLMTDSDSGVRPASKKPERRRSRPLTPPRKLSSMEQKGTLLEQSVLAVKALEFSADCDDSDAVTEAFETFMRASMNAIKHEQGGLLDALEPKDQLLSFLVDVYEKRRQYRARVASIIARLLCFDSWRAVAEMSPLLHIAVRDLMIGDEDEAVAQKMPEPRTEINVRQVVAEAVAQGAIGVLYVRVVAAYNLVNADESSKSDAYVRVMLSGSTQRTYIICNDLNPRWDAAPFLFNVPSPDAAVSLDVLDSDMDKDDPIGSLHFSLTDAPSYDSSAGFASHSIRCALQDVPHGELEIELAFCNAETHGPAAALQRHYTLMLGNCDDCEAIPAAPSTVLGECDDSEAHSRVHLSSSRLAGWLGKRGPTFDYNWHRRWCVLQGPPKAAIGYYADEKCLDKRGTARLYGGSRVYCLVSQQAPGEAVKHRSERPCAFVLDPTPSAGKARRLFYFDALDEGNLAQWVREIKQAIKEQASGEDSGEEIIVNQRFLKRYASNAMMKAASTTSSARKSAVNGAIFLAHKVAATKAEGFLKSR